MKLVIVTSFALCVTSVVWADVWTDPKTGITLTYTISSDEAAITDCDERGVGALEIPSILDGFPVTAIGSYAFKDCTGLTSVIIPEGVTTIKADAFYNCTNLVSIKLPTTLTSIWDYVFYDCVSLASIEIPANVTSIGYFSFTNCTSLESVYILNIASWCALDLGYGPHPFSYAKKVYLNGEEITHLCIPSDVKSIEQGVFVGLSSLISLEITEGVSSIGDWAFSGCKGLTSVTIPSSATSIGGCAFSGCTALISLEFQGPPPTAVGDSAFPATVGYYQPEYASEWEAVIVDGKWNNLTMTIDLSFDVSIVTVGNGTFTGADAYIEGDEVTVSATADEGWVFCGWNTDPVTPSEFYTFTMPAEDVTLTAYFAPEKAIQQYIATNGLISPEQIGEIAMKAPVIGVEDGKTKLSLKLMKATTLTENAWTEVALKDSESAVADGQLSIELAPEADEKTAFYKFVVPAEQSK